MLLIVVLVLKFTTAVALGSRISNTPFVMKLLPSYGSWVFCFIWVICYVELWLLIDRCGILSVRAFKMHNTYFGKQLLLWQLSGHLQLSLHDWLLMESNMLEKRIEQMKEGFEGIPLNLLKFNWKAPENLTLILLFYTTVLEVVLWIMKVRENKFLENIIFWTLWRMLKACAVTSFHFTIV